MAVLEAELVRNRAQHLVLADGPLPNKYVESRLVLRLLGLSRRVDLLLHQKPAFGQELQDVFIVACHV